MTSGPTVGPGGTGGMYGAGGGGGGASLNNAPSGYLVPSVEENLFEVAQADYLKDRIDLDEYERRIEWLLRNPDRRPGWAGTGKTGSIVTVTCW